jgi:hypothetical protein
MGCRTNIDVQCDKCTRKDSCSLRKHIDFQWAELDGKPIRCTLKVIVCDKFEESKKVD